MQDFLWQIKDTDSFTFFTTAVFVAAVFWFIREIVGAPMLALTGAPFLMLGGLVSPIVFRSQLIALSFDDEVNVAMTAAVGVLAALIALLLANWLFSALRDRRVRNARIVWPADSDRPRRLN
jgi:hypothetical protein